MAFFLHPKPNKEETLIRREAKAFADECLRPTAISHDKEAFFDPQLFKEAAKRGLAAIHYDPKYGGRGLPFRCYLAALDEFAQASLSFAISISVNHLSLGCIQAFGNEEQKTKYIPKLANGEHLGAFCLSEPNSGSDAKSLILSAKEKDGNYLLNGTKSWCTNGGPADVYVVMTRTGDLSSSKGISAFIIEKEFDGFSAAKPEDKMGLSASTTAIMNFDNCHVSKTQLLGQLGDGLKVALANLESGRMAIAATSIGLANEALYRGLNFGLGQKAQGLEFLDANRFKLAEHLANLQSAKSLLWEGAKLYESGEKVTQAASQAKLISTELCVSICSDVVEIMGIEGLKRENEVERFLRDAKVLTIVEGTTQIQRLVLAREMEKELS